MEIAITPENFWIYALVLSILFLIVTFCLVPIIKEILSIIKEKLGIKKKFIKISNKHWIIFITLLLIILMLFWYNREFNLLETHEVVECDDNVDWRSCERIYEAKYDFYCGAGIGDNGRIDCKWKKK